MPFVGLDLFTIDKTNLHWLHYWAFVWICNYNSSLAAGGQLLQRYRVALGIINHGTTEMPIIILFNLYKKWQDTFLDNIHSLTRRGEFEILWWLPSLHRLLTRVEKTDLFRKWAQVLCTDKHYHGRVYKLCLGLRMCGFVTVFPKCISLVGPIWIMKQSITKAAGIILNQSVERQIGLLWFPSKLFLNNLPDQCW